MPTRAWRYTPALPRIRNLDFMGYTLPALILMCATVPALAEGDPEAGAIKAYTCTGCHGIPGYNNAYPNYRVPKLGGQNYEYIVSALKGYRLGERRHPTMRAQSGSLSDEDMEDVAAYFVSLAPETDNRETVGKDLPGYEKSATCRDCHGENGGVTLQAVNPRLAGQYANYLLHSLKEYKSGARVNGAMQTFVAELSERDLADLAEFYAAQDGLIDLSIQ